MCWWDVKPYSINQSEWFAYVNEYANEWWLCQAMPKRRRRKLRQWSWSWWRKKTGRNCARWKVRILRWQPKQRHCGKSVVGVYEMFVMIQLHIFTSGGQRDGRSCWHDTASSTNAADADSVACVDASRRHCLPPLQSGCRPPTKLCLAAADIAATQQSFVCGL